MKRPEVFFKHMLMAIEKIGQYVKNYNSELFHKDQKTVDAVIRQLEIIGEAAKNIPKDLVKDSPIPWNRITGLRDKLIHDYMGVDVGVVWKTATEGLKDLKIYLEEMINFKG